MLRQCVIVLLGLLSCVHSAYRLCVLNDDENFHTVISQCQLLHNNEAQVQCTFGVDRMDCLRQVSEGSADFGVFEAEELLVASENDLFQEILITHRLHSNIQDDWEFGVVALVSNSAGITDLSKLQGKRLCHPGYDPFSSRYDWSEIFSLYFEDRVVKEECQDNLSVEENRIKSLAEFFGDSCKPGEWSSMHQTDSALKDKYPNLCALCDIPSECSTSDKYWGRQGALFCLSDCLGDIAWGRLDDARFHFKSNLAVCSDVSLLCPDGTTMSLDSEKPCLWMGRPNSVVAAHRQKAQGVQQSLFNIFNMTNGSTVSKEYNALSRLLESHSHPLILPLTTSRDYLEKIPGYLSANTMMRCGQNDRSIRICMSTTQKQSKCEWLAVAAKGYGIEPLITCIPSTNCFESVAKNLSDVVITETDDLFIAIRDFQLEPLLVHNHLHAKNVKHISAIVKTNSNINNIADLRGKNACLTTFNGQGWNSLILALKDAKLLEEICPYSEAVSKFFSGICFTNPKTGTLPHKNMRVCSVDDSFVIDGTFEPVAESKLQEKNAMAFQCLATGGGDVAFISMDTVKKYTDKIIPGELWAAGLFSKDYRQLCDRNSSTNCFLSWSSMGQVLVNKNLPKVKKEDVISVFSSLDNVFGNINAPSHRTFEIFSKFEDVFSTEDEVIGMAMSSRLELYEQFSSKATARPKNYELNIQNIAECTIKSKSNNIYIKTYLIIIGLLFQYLQNYY